MSRLDHSPSPPQDLSGSQLTIPSDSEAYSSLSPPSSSPPQSSDNNGARPVVIYQPPTVWSILRGAAINLVLPFVNGMMLGFGELLAHEWAFRLGWNSTNVSSMASPSGFRADTLFLDMATPSCIPSGRTWRRDEGGPYGTKKKERHTRSRRGRCCVVGIDSFASTKSIFDRNGITVSRIS
jgi:hypothetical protein